MYLAVLKMYHAVVHIFRGICKDCKKETVSVFMSVCVHLYVFRSARNKLAPTVPIFMKLYVEGLLDNLLRKFKFN
jgi:hypothetical protein